MFTTKTIALTAGLSLAMFGFAAPVSAGQHQHQNQSRHRGNYTEGYGFGFDVPDVYIDLGHREDSHISWCYRHRPNYNENTDMYFARGFWQPCVAPFD